MLKKYINICFLVSLAIFVSCNSGSKEKKQGEKQEENLKVSDIPEEKFSDVTVTPDDTLVFVNVIEWAQATKLTKKPLDSVIVEVAKYFEGAPYAAHTLEQEGPEKLVINLREFDCTTYAENVMAFSFCIKSGDVSFSDFLRKLQALRYRHGVIDEYPSRLHYFSEWITDNRNKGLVEVVSEEFGDTLFDVSVDFMSENPEKYPKLANNPTYVEEISNFENRISQNQFKMVSEKSIKNVDGHIRNGDIIAFMSDIEGLDVGHLGFALHTTGGELHFIHASTNGDRVRISEKTLSKYVEGREDCPGIIVVRPVF